MMKEILIAAFLVGSVHAKALPDPNLTPGVLCQTNDSDFKGFDYPERIARCNRNILSPEKEEVAKSYGNIPRTDWPKYEFDHLIPLCAGGSNSSKNLFPQPIAEAKEKDKLENDICLRMKAGTLLQSDAIKMVHAWFTTSPDPSSAVDKTIPSQNPVFNVECRTNKDIRITFLAENELQISHTIIALSEPDGDHEILRVDDTVYGKALNVQKGGLKDHDEFKLSPTDEDHFTLFLKTGELTSESRSFKGYMKVSFDGERPSLKAITCDKK